MIEESITALTSAIKDLTAALLKSPVPSAAPAEEPAKRTRRTKEQIAADTAATTTAPATESSVPPTVDLPKLRELTQQLLDAGRVDDVRAFFAGYGVKGAKDLPADKYQDAHDKLVALLAAAPAPTPEPEKPAAAPEVTLDQLIALGAKLRDGGKVPEIKAIIQPLGIGKIRDAKPEQFAQLFAALSKAAAALDEDPAA